LAEVHGAARVGGLAEEVGGRAHVLLVVSEQEDEQGLREAVRQRVGLCLRGGDTADGEEAGPCLRLSKQFRKGDFCEVRARQGTTPGTADSPR
jgi:hypothetical protein